MILKNFEVHLAIFLTCLPLIFQMAGAGTIAPSSSANRYMFAADALRVIAANRIAENVIYSPASIQTCVALAYFGAKGRTAEEMRNGLRLGSGDRSSVANNFASFLKSTFKSTEGGGPQLTMANRIYINDNLQINPEFNDIAATYFNTKAESIHFGDGSTAADKINKWVEDQTNNKIQNVLQADSVDDSTSAVLINAIYFKGKWAKPFSASSTHKTDFMVTPDESVLIDMMFLDEKVKYAHFTELDATAIEMAYENSDVSMLIILPNQLNGLQKLENKLADIDLNALASRMTVADVDVYLPKFRIEFDIDLKKPLSELGMSSMFSDQADFSDLFKTDLGQKVSDVKHKAFIDVNEAGSEAAAATYLKIVPMSLNLEQRRFRADHPFVFVIRNSQAVYFAGHVAKF